MRRSQVHTELLVEEFELGMLWDEYRLVGDIVVRILLHFSCMHISDYYLFSHSQTVSLKLTSMNFCPLTYYINSVLFCPPADLIGTDQILIRFRFVTACL